jgi:hypothetical protein
MKEVKRLRLGTWEICCNDMVTMLINDSIEATDQKVEDFFLFLNADDSPNINFCPYCGVKIPRIKRGS